MHAVGLGVGAVSRRGEHVDVGLAKVRELLGRGTHEHLMDEERLARALAHHADLARVVAVGAGKAVHHVELATKEIARNALADALVGLTRDGDVHLAPAHLVVHLGVVDDVAVVGRTPRALAGIDHERAVGRKPSLAVGERDLNEPRR